MTKRNHEAHEIVYKLFEYEGTSWTQVMCLCKSFLCLARCGHSVQGKGLSLVCVLRCLSRCDLNENDLEQNEHSILAEVFAMFSALGWFIASDDIVVEQSRTLPRYIENVV